MISFLNLRKPIAKARKEAETKIRKHVPKQFARKRKWLKLLQLHRSQQKEKLLLRSAGSPGLISKNSLDANAQTALAFLFMEIDSCFKIGWILKPHGLKGEVTVMLDEDAPEDFSSIESVFVEQNKRLVPYFIKAISAQGKKAFVKFEDIDSVETAMKISKQSLYIQKSIRPKSGRGEFYNDEIIDFEVHDEENGIVGKNPGSDASRS